LPASCEKGPSDITHSVDPDQPLHDIEQSHVIKLPTHQEIYVPLMWRMSKSADATSETRRLVWVYTFLLSYYYFF